MFLADCWDVASIMATGKFYLFFLNFSPFAGALQDKRTAVRTVMEIPLHRGIMIRYQVS